VTAVLDFIKISSGFFEVLVVQRSSTHEMIQKEI